MGVPQRRFRLAEKILLSSIKAAWERSFRLEKSQRYPILMCPRLEDLDQLDEKISWRSLSRAVLYDAVHQPPPVPPLGSVHRTGIGRADPTRLSLARPPLTTPSAHVDRALAAGHGVQSRRSSQSGENQDPQFGIDPTRPAPALFTGLRPSVIEIDIFAF